MSINLSIIIIAILCIITLKSIFKLTKIKKNILTEKFSQNTNYDTKCDSDSTDEDRKKCTESFSKISNKLYDFCFDKNKDFNMNQDINESLCKKWIGLLSSECVSEKCIDNTINKIDDWNETLEKMKYYKTLEKLQISKSKFKLYNNENFSKILNSSNTIINQKKKLNDEISKIESLHSNILQKINDDNKLSKSELEKFNNYVENYPYSEKKKLKENVNKGYDFYKKLKLIDSDNKIKDNQFINDFRSTSDKIGKNTFKKIIYNYISDHDKTVLNDSIENINNYYLL
jgi:hypothetical protein